MSWISRLLSVFHAKRRTFDGNLLTSSNGLQGFPDLPDDSALSVNGAAFYRHRADHEVEAAQCSGRTAQARLRSINIGDPITVVFVNGTAKTVQVIWLDYQGNEVAFGRLEPNSDYWVKTYRTHPWIVRDVTSKERLNWGSQQVLYGVQRDLVNLAGIGYIILAIIREPPPVSWSQYSHKIFPAGFKRAVATFLLCHSSWAKIGEQLRETKRGHCRATLGDLPNDLVVLIVKHAAPHVRQQMACPHEEGRMDLKPITVPCTKEEFESMIPTTNPSNL